MNTAHYSVSTLTSEDYDALCDAQPAETFIPFEQSSVWPNITDGDVGSSHEGFFAVRDGDDLIAFASALRISRRLRESIVMLNGPVFAVERTPEREAGVAAAFREHFRQTPGITPLYIRAHLEHPASVSGALESIERGGFEREIVVDLAGKDAETLKKSFSSNARTRINRAARAGVEIHEITENRAQYFEDVCFPIMLETADRDDFELMSLTRYRSTLDDAAAFTRLFVAYAPETDDSPEDAEKIPVGWMMTNEYHFRGCYYYGGSNGRAQETSAMFALMHRILTELAESGNLAAGLTGIASERFPELKGVEAFKRRFSKTVLEYPRLYDIPLNGPRYAAVRTIIKARAEGPARIRAALQKISQADLRSILSRKKAESQDGSLPADSGQ